MKNEIKEIVVDDGELIAYYKDGSFQAFDTLLQEVLDYITNLQESEAYYYGQYKDYKAKNKKAIEYNYELQERYCHSALFDDLVASKIYEITEKQLNILQGEDTKESEVK